MNLKSILPQIVGYIIGALVQVLKPEQVEKVADKALDWCEDAIAKREDWYDPLLVSLINIVREAFSIEDND